MCDIYKARTSDLWICQWRRVSKSMRIISEDKLRQMQLTAGNSDRRWCFDRRAQKKTSMVTGCGIQAVKRLRIVYQAAWARRAQRKHCWENCQSNWSTRAAENFKSPFDANAELQKGLEVWLPCFCSLRSKIDIFRALNKSLQVRGSACTATLCAHQSIQHEATSVWEKQMCFPEG